MPYKHTTLIDFLYFYNTNIKILKKFDFIVIHLGVVDFSPRPKKMLENIRIKKALKVNTLYNIDFNDIDPIQFSNILYNEEQTGSLYSKEFLENYILNKLKEIDNLIYIGINPILFNWNGNYKKTRPKNINDVMKFNDVLIKNLNYSIDISNWTEKEIKEYTVDNIHFNSKGFDFIKSQIKNKIKEINEK